MNAKLVVVTGKTSKRIVELDLPCVLGRSREADVTVAHPLISRRHCEISEAGAGSSCQATERARSASDLGGFGGRGGKLTGG